MKYTIIPIPAFKDNYIWTLVNKKNTTAVCIDPGDAQPVQAVLDEKKLSLGAILITHHHWDHTGGIDDLLKTVKVPVYGPAGVAQVTHPVSEGDHVTLPALDMTLYVLDIPGHTLDHIAYYNDSLLFSGDTLFASGCGRLFEGTPSQMYHSLQKISALPPEIKVYCGHEYTEANLRFALAVEPDNQHLRDRLHTVAQWRQQAIPSLPSTIQQERLNNPFLRVQQAAVKQAAQDYAGKPLLTEVDVFAAIRQWKDNFL